MIKKTILAIAASGILSGLSIPATTQAELINNTRQATTTATHNSITAYFLLDNHSFGEEGSLADLINKVDAGSIKIDRLVFAFMNPKMSPVAIDADIKNNDLAALLRDAGVFNAPKGDQTDYGQLLSNDIAQLKNKNIQILFAVGGWAYSCRDPEQLPTQGNQVGCTSNFPLTPSMKDAFKQANLQDDITDVQPFSTTSIATYTQAWADTAKAFGAAGIDFDYEENWFAAETTYRHPVLASPSPIWARNPNGPYVLPYSVIKYAVTLNALEDSAQKVQPQALLVTTAAPAPAAFNIHTYNGNEPKGNNFWCPVTKNGSAVCGQANGNTDSHDVIVSGNLKGIDYDVAHASTLGTIGIQTDAKNSIDYKDVTVLGNDIIGNLNSLNIMSYDLDDGYDTIGSSWCIGTGKTPSGETAVMSRSPGDNGAFPYLNQIDCSISSQAAALVAQFKHNVINAPSVKHPPLLDFGLEAGFPNYPINIDPKLPGGGNADLSDGHYRWNDPYVGMDLPLYSQTSTTDLTTLENWSKMHASSDNPSFANVPDIHSTPLVVNQNLFKQMSTAGADGMILWSINNADYNDHVSKASWDFKQMNPFIAASFADDYKNNGYTQDLLNILFKDSASPEDILKTASQFFHGDSEITATKKQKRS